MLTDKRLKYDISTLYVAKCRRCILSDLITHFTVDGRIIEPTPDYFDYYTILQKKNNGVFVDIFNPKSLIINYIDCENSKRYYEGIILFEHEPLLNYVTYYNKLNFRECLISLEAIVKSLGLKMLTYGYIDLDNKNLLKNKK